MWGRVSDPAAERKLGNVPELACPPAAAHKTLISLPASHSKHLANQTP